MCRSNTGNYRRKLPDSLSVSEGENRDKATTVVSPKFKKEVGSIAGHHFGDEELAKLRGGYLSLARELLGGKNLVATGRKVVKAEDLAVFMMILKFFTGGMNADGSLPTARWREMWQALYGTGDIERAWCHHRFAKIRNFLTKNDLLDWEDESFVVGVLDERGRFVPGKAAKWKAGEDLMAMMEAAGMQQVGVGAGVIVEEKEEEEDILYGCNQPDQVCKQEDGEEKATLYGHKAVSQFLPTPNPRQSASFLDVLDRLGIWIPLSKPRFAGYSTGQLRMAA